MRLPEKPDRLLAVGDIHGHLDELNKLLSAVQPTMNDKVVFLGDYIDRGPNSKGVLERLSLFQKHFPQSVFIRGNHEQMFIDSLIWHEVEPLLRHVQGQNPAWHELYNELKERAGFFGLQPHDLERIWWVNGGDATFNSFDRSLDNVKDSHRHILNQTKTFHEEWYPYNKDRPWEGEGFLFVHAGIDLCHPPQRQSQLAMMNYRNFPEPDKDSPWTVVHGHTVKLNGPEMNAKRINLDTGIYLGGGHLTCCDVLTRQIWQIPKSAVV